MKSLFVPKNEPGATKGQAATGLGRTVVLPAEPAKPQPGAEQAIEQRMFRAMDMAAAVLLEALEKPLGKNAEAVDLVTKMKVMDRCQDWMIKREKLKPKDDGVDTSGVDALRALAEGPAAVVERFHKDTAFINALKSKGWLPPVPKRPTTGGRRSKEETAQVKEFDARRRALFGEAEANDSSKWEKFNLGNG